MIGTYPTVGCLLLMDKSSFLGIGNVREALQATVAIGEGEAALGGDMHPMLLFVQEADEMTVVHVEFDEDEVEGIRQATGLSIEQLFLPYVWAAKAIPGVFAVGIGFELSPPSDLGKKSLQEAGVAVLFTRDEAQKSWLRWEMLPLVGHYV